jgi:hypothetical protein
MMLRTIVAVLHVAVVVLWRATALEPARGLLGHGLRRAYEHTWDAS